jgi:hypothetical protein
MSPSQSEIQNLIAEHSAELSKLASDAGLHLLVFLLGMVQLEAGAQPAQRIDPLWPA